MNKKKINLSCYNDVENLSNFKNKIQIQKYRTTKLNGCKKTIKFIKKQFSKPHKKIKVFELGSGNSKLLYALSLQGMISTAYGIEISLSRFEFAEKWKSDLKINNVQNINANILDMDLSKFFNIDLFICVDIAIQFLDPMRKNNVYKLLKHVFKILNENACIILELMSMENIIKKIRQNNGIHKTWQYFEKPDPFAYMIESLEQDKNGDVIWTKNFIHRQKNIQNFSFKMKNVLKPYTPKQMKNLLNEIGFSQIKIYKNFDFNKFDKKFDEYVIVGKKVIS